MGKILLFIYFENSDVVTFFFFFTTIEALHFDKLVKVQDMNVYTIACSLTWRNMVFTPSLWITHVLFFFYLLSKKKGTIKRFA
jgi:hypothetical protein